jgi:hypothetical protein
MDHTLLVRVVDSRAHLDEQLEALANARLPFVEEPGNRNPPDEFHNKIRSPPVCRSGIEDLGDVWMVHHGEGLAFGLEAGDDFI